MKIAVVGLRGIPATYGGIEKHCEKLYPIIVQMGHSVTIYARKGYIDENIKEFEGIKIVPLFTFNSKHLEATFHTFWALLHAVFSDADIIHFHAQGPCLFAWLSRLLSPRKKLIFTCHGLDWQRNKWNKLAKDMIYLGEICSAKYFDTHITVSRALEDYYKARYNVNAITIPNGTEVQTSREPKLIKEKFGLNGKDYILFVGRLVPEKAPHKLIEAFKTVYTEKKLVIVGGSSATDSYEAYLKKLAGNDPRIIFTSFLYGNILSEMYSNAYLYVSTSELEGLPLTLLEAMSYGIPSLVSPIKPHKEILGNENYGYLFKSDKLEDIRKKLKAILCKPERELVEKGRAAQEKIETQHNWESMARKLVGVYKFTKYRQFTMVSGSKIKLKQIPLAISGK